MAKKRITNDDLHSRYTDENVEMPFSGNYDDDVFAALDAEDVSDGTLSIFEIIPDHTQPRRILPAEVRWKWNGSATGYGDVLEYWEDEVLQLCDGQFPTKEILRGKATLSDYMIDEPLVQAFGKLVDFAANIRDIGLNHPIGVVKRGALYRIVYGERRWTAFQLLQHYLGDTSDNFRSIPVKIATVGEWQLAKAQAAENFQTDPLNAISKARQFAKLLIIARTDSGEEYDSWNATVISCDRPYFAQVANGDLHRIPRGMGPQFEQSMSVSTDMMRKYRSILRIFDDAKVNDALWMLGDAGDWALTFLLDIGQYLEVDDVAQLLNSTDGYTVNAFTVSQTEEALREAVAGAKKAEELAKKQAERDAKPPTLPEEVDKSTWPSYKWIGLEVYHGNVKVFVEDAQDAYNVIVVHDDDRRGLVHISTLIDTDLGEQIESVRPAVSSPFAKRDDVDTADTPQGGTNRAIDKHGIPLMVGQTVRLKTGKIGIVEEIKGTMVNVDVPDLPYMGKGEYGDSLEIVPTGETGSENVTYPFQSPDGADQSIADESPDVMVWAGKPVRWDGFRANVIGEYDDGTVEIKFQKTGIDRRVPVDELTLDVVNVNQRAVDALTPPDGDEGEDLPEGSGDLILLNTDAYRPVLSLFEQMADPVQLIVHKDDRVAAAQMERNIKALLMAEMSDYTRDELSSLTDAIQAEIEIVTAAALASIGDYFHTMVKEFDEVRNG